MLSGCRESGLPSLFKRAVRESFRYDFFCNRFILYDYGFRSYLSKNKQPNLERPYKTWLYPVTPIIYLLIGTGFCILF
jgi:hypothetical protein